MAFPIILVDSATGSDTQASGAGPSTALFGTTDASTDGTGTVVTLTAGTDLTNVATDGSHVIFLNDTTAGARNFGKITAKAGSGGATPNVTVSNAFGISLSGKSWAIGGRLASLGSTTSRKLCENNSGVGDLMPGWTIELQSGHTETITSTLRFRGDGNTTDGAITIKCASGTRPIITQNMADIGIDVRSLGFCIEGFQLKNSHASGSYGIYIYNGGVLIKDVLVGGGTQNLTNEGIYLRQDFGAGCVVENCEVTNCRRGIEIQGGGLVSTITGCYVHHCTSHGIYANGGSNGSAGLIDNCLIVSNGGNGIQIAVSNSTARNNRITNNTISGNSGDGIQFDNTTQGITENVINNNIITFNGGYALNFSSQTVPILSYNNFRIVGNNHYRNTSGFSNLTLTIYIEVGTTNINPNYYGYLNFTPNNLNLQGKAYPLSFNGVSNNSYPGAITPYSPTNEEIAEAIWEYSDRTLTS